MVITIIFIFNLFLTTYVLMPAQERLAYGLREATLFFSALSALMQLLPIDQQLLNFFAAAKGSLTLLSQPHHPTI